MLSLGTELDLAFWIASANVGLPAGSPPPVRAATSTFLMSLANSLPRRAATTPFFCFFVGPFDRAPLCPPPPPPRRTRAAPGGRRSAPDGMRSREADLAAPQRSYRRRARRPGRRGS